MDCCDAGLFNSIALRTRTDFSLWRQKRPVPTVDRDSRGKSHLGETTVQSCVQFAHSSVPKFSMCLLKYHKVSRAPEELLYRSLSTGIAMKMFQCGPAHMVVSRAGRRNRSQIRATRQRQIALCVSFIVPGCAEADAPQNKGIVRRSWYPSAASNSGAWTKRRPEMTQVSLFNTKSYAEVEGWAVRKSWMVNALYTSSAWATGHLCNCRICPT
jgi:hypothetical protein